MDIKRLLVANRGEIALRVIRACREIGIETVAVYSDADAAARHVRAADFACRIGPAPASESYLNIAAVIDAARAAGADAVHPGYGFLSERAAFADACVKAGLIFVGPPALAIEKMGSKIGARALMEKAGVPLVPGRTPDDQSDRGVAAAAEAIGFPVLVKASAGGGGKGMRAARDVTALAEAIPAARREAEAAFGDGTLYVERLIERPRHVEIQIFADDHGHAVHLFERECSIQRRHQKIVEESPSPALTPRVREAMGAAAVAAARTAGYRNAGTIEFLLEGEGDAAHFYFLEMNTRLQVEHPVTELVTGTDLVRAQLAVAAGRPLPWRQADLRQRGHAVECRVYAEDPANGFLPQAGPLRLYREPSGPGIRIDSGVEEGADVPVQYDPMLAKVIAYGETRDHAIDRAAAALRAFPILGVRTNVPFLITLLGHRGFRSGRVHTGFVEEHLASLLETGPPSELVLAAAAFIRASPSGPSPASGAAPVPDPWSQLTGWGRGLKAEGRTPDANMQISRGPAPGELIGRDGDRVEQLFAVTAGDKTWVFHEGRVHEIVAAGSAVRRGAHAQGALTAPMPATIIEIKVAAGDVVKKGDILIVLEAMKMELPVRAPGDGRVTAIHCRPGDLVQPETSLIDLE